VVVHIYNPSILDTEQEDCQLNANLGYIASSRSAWGYITKSKKQQAMKK
jgi:hypothetical protein